MSDKTFKRQIQKIQMSCPESGMQLCNEERRATSELCRECELNAILSAHNAELDRIAEGMPKIHRPFVCDPKKIGEYTNKVIDAQLKTDQAYIQAQKGASNGQS